MNEGTTATDAILIEAKTEIEFGDQPCQANQTPTTYGSTNVEYGKTHQRMAYDDSGAGPSEQWIDDKHFLTQTGPNSANSSTTANSSSNNDDNEQQRCKSSKNYKALEPCSCPLCARVYSNVSNLRQHMRLIHNPTSGILTTLSCFSDVALLIEYFNLVCCPLCQKSFTSDLYLKRHYLSMHGSAIPTQTESNVQQNNPNSPQLQNTQPTSQPQVHF